MGKSIKSLMLVITSNISGAPLKVEAKEWQNIDTNTK